MTIWFGAAYYHEYQPYERLERDIELMSKASVSLVRVGESTWSLWEPEEGRFEFDWIERVVDCMHEAGIRVILGTPTYAIPPWLAIKHPEMMSERLDGSSLAYGGRQNVDISNPNFRFYAERVIRELGAHFGKHPAIVGYQVDNEAGLELSANPDAIEGFRNYLRDKYSVEEINRIWGLNYWSHRINSWDELWGPGGNTTPGYDLEWRRYQAGITTEFLAWQEAIIRQYIRDDAFVTHCLAGGHGRPGANRFRVGAVLDIAAENIYYATQESLLLPHRSKDSHLKAAPEFVHEDGVWGLSLKADLAYATKHERYLVTETNARTIGLAHDNFPAFDGQWRLAAHTMVARGARSIAYWHFHSNHVGHEAYWGGMLSHDLDENRCFNELVQLGAELRDLGDLMEEAVPDAEVGILYSYDSSYALGFQPPLRVPSSEDADQRSYERIFNTWYRGFFDAGCQMRILSELDDLEAYKVLVVPALYVASDALLERLASYVRNGGVLLLTLRSGYADENGTLRHVRAPGILREATGASYQEFSNLNSPVTVVNVGDDDAATNRDALATAWADGLVPETASVLLRYEHPHFAQFAAVTRHRYGNGTLTYAGTLLDPVTTEGVARGVLADAGVIPEWGETPDTVRVNSSRLRSGDQAWLIANWSWTEVEVRVPFEIHDAFSGDTIKHGETISLGPWSSRIGVRGSASRQAGN